MTVMTSMACVFYRLIAIVSTHLNRKIGTIDVTKEPATKIEVRCTAKLKSAVREIAWSQKTSMSEWILTLVEAELKRTSVKSGKHGTELPQKGE